MDQASSSPIRVLVALADEWREELRQVLEQAGFFVLMADSKDEASSMIRMQCPSAVVMISDWALESGKGNADGLMELVKGKVPTVSLISPRTWQDADARWFDYLYHPPLHEYCSVPVDRQEIINFLEKAPKAAENAIGS
jgi:DNA-binding NtrC family response regulator